MKKISSIAGLFILIAGMALNVPRAMACSCIMPEPPLEAMANAEAVFAGRVTEVNPPIDGETFVERAKVTFEVSRAWKGVDSNEAVLFTSGSSASCGYNFEEGKEYLIYAYEEEGNLGTGLCTRTALLSDASEDLAALGVGQEVAEADEDMSFIIGGAILVAVLAGIYYYSLGRNKKARSILGNK